MGRIILLLLALVVVDWCLMARIWKMALGIAIVTGVVGVSWGRQNMRGLASPAAQSGKQSPLQSLMDMPLIFAGMGLMVIPGFLTDILGVALLLPLTRKLFRPLFKNHPFMKMQQQFGSFQAEMEQSSGFDDGDTLNANVVRRSEQDSGPGSTGGPDRIED